MGFFPDDIELSEIFSPSEILEDAKREWDAHSNGILLLQISQALLDSEEELVLEVYIVHSPSKRMAKVLSVAHRPNHPYPIEIRPESFNIPKYLKKSYKTQSRRSLSPLFSIADQMRAIESAPEFVTQTITNEWVCDTPTEFREKLEKAFNLGTVKSTILNIIAGSSQGDDELFGSDEPQAVSEMVELTGDAPGHHDADQA